VDHRVFYDLDPQVEKSTANLERQVELSKWQFIE
jgi:hypothetical protein